MRLLSHTTFRAAPPARALTTMMRLLACGLLVAVACGGKTPIQPPPPPPPNQLQMSCPAPILAEATKPEGADAHFDSPSPSGGRAPYSVECTPGSGSVFPAGETVVRCTASDADMAQAACGFTVTVRVSRSLARTRFTAFGDSIALGVVSLAPLVTLGPPDTYPFKLERLLAETYPTQSFTVFNRGVSGERTQQGAARLPGVLDADKPEVLLLLEGTNAVRIVPTNTAVAHLRSMIVAARQRGVDVMIATVMAISPQRDRAQPPGTMAAIRALNERIFELAIEYNLGSPVDLFALFEANPHLLGQDGLHPTLEGQTRIAEAFRDEIIRRYERRETMTSRFLNVPFHDAR